MNRYYFMQGVRTFCWTVALTAGVIGLCLHLGLMR
jgi:hypothetical protein